MCIVAVEVLVAENIQNSNHGMIIFAPTVDHPGSTTVTRNYYYERPRMEISQLIPPDPRGKVSRHTFWWTRPNAAGNECTCNYTYGAGVNMKIPSAKELRDFSALMGELWTDLGFDKMRRIPNSVNINLYEDGSQGCGWHADDESLFDGKVQDCRILSMSLGDGREFWLANKLEGRGDQVGVPRGRGYVRQFRLQLLSLSLSQLLP